MSGQIKELSYEYLISSMDKLYSLIKPYLLKNEVIHSFVDFKSLLFDISGKSFNDFPVLYKAIQSMNLYYNGVIEFYKDVLPFILECAFESFELKDIQEMPILSKDGYTRNERNMGKISTNKNLQSVTFSKQEVRCILANIFLLNVREHSSTGSVDFYYLYSVDIPVGLARVECLVCYFFEEFLAIKKNTEDEDNEIIFERHQYRMKENINGPVLIPDTFVDDYELKQSFSFDNYDEVVEDYEDYEKYNNFKSFLNVHVDSMENMDNEVFVDFANKNIQIHKMIPSATQEEVLFSTSPECILSMLISDTLRDNEFMLIKNVKRYCHYSGYLDTFKFEGSYRVEKLENSQQRFDVVVIDACYNNHYTKQNIHRDISKAYMSYRQFYGKRISTGNWGCGIFGGNELYKFLQQLIAAREAGCSLDFSTFGKKKQAIFYLFIVHLLHHYKVTINDVIRLFYEYKEDQSFENYFIAQITSNSL